MEQCSQHYDLRNANKELTEKTDKILAILEKVDSILTGGGLNDPEKIGLVAEVKELKARVIQLENDKKNVLVIVYKVFGALAVGGVSIKTLLDVLVK